MIKQAFIILMIVNSLASIGSAQEIQGTLLLCKAGATVRTVRLLGRDSGACEAIYLKEGIEKTIAKSSTFSSCERTMNSVKSNLEKANFKCRELKDSRMSLSSEN